MKVIEGVKIKQLNIIPDKRGRLMEILRSDDNVYKNFGQVYMTTVLPDVVKAWHYHQKQTDSMACISGMVLLVLYDNRKDSSTKNVICEYCIGIYNPLLVQIPPGILHGLKCIGTEEAIVINIPDFPYHHQQPDEYRIDPHSKEIGYDWRKTDG
jgi:dTDP-4-dehydrorhamnose 3,5-epimerase